MFFVRLVLCVTLQQSSTETKYLYVMAPAFVFFNFAQWIMYFCDGVIQVVEFLITAVGRDFGLNVI